MLNILTALYSPLVSQEENIKIRSYAIAPVSQLGFFTQAPLLQQSILVERTWFLPKF
ncbi:MULTISPECIES: hypothetical protein [unclassified Microcoleus]|uniref:hypothetical protein n=1 Tax=unclassified Microcoleus TaxID=2642155 RepID=UPI002FD3BA00